MVQTPATYKLRQIIRIVLSRKGKMCIMEIIDELQKIGIVMLHEEAIEIIESTSPFDDVFIRTEEGNKVYYGLLDDSDIDFY